MSALLPNKRPDGWPRRSDTTLMTEHELALFHLGVKIDQECGASVALTDCVGAIATARSRLADHLEGIA